MGHTSPPERFRVTRSDTGITHPAQESVKLKESAVSGWANALAKNGDAEGIRLILTELRPLFGVIQKAKTAKIVRNVIDTVATVPGTTQLQVSGLDFALKTLSL